MKIFFLTILAACFLSSVHSKADTENRMHSDFIEPNFPFISSVLDARHLESFENNLTPRGILLNLGRNQWACFDTELLRVSVIWTGKGVSPVSMSQGSYHLAGVKASEGQRRLPQPIGIPWLANGIYPGWQAGKTILQTDPRDVGTDSREIGRGPLPQGMGRFHAIHLEKQGARLEYEIFGHTVQERMTSSPEGTSAIRRRFQLNRVNQPLWIALGRKPGGGANQVNVAVFNHLNPDKPAAQLVEEKDGLIAVRVAPSATPVDFSVVFALDGEAKPWREENENRVETRWPETVTTQGALSSSEDAYVLDHIALPTDNIWKRNVRLADIVFFKDGRAAFVTFDGDVWLASGLNDELREVQWKRFTSGLHEPLGISIRNEELFVFDRNGIWRLRDTNGDDEADVHELFSNAFVQTAETREFASGLRVSPDGSFFIAKGGQQSSTLGKHNGTVLRISPDGKESVVLGWGLRQPFLGVHPQTGLVTVSDQQGHYIPATPLHVVENNQFYGYLNNLLPKEKYPAPIADPVVWIPHAINASGAGQVWLHGARMGPLNESMIHIGYNRPEVFVVLMNSRFAKKQAAVLSLTRDLPFAPLAGAVDPIDGQLYITGFQIWGTTAAQISGLMRVRYTGAPSPFPREVTPMENGILLTFDLALDKNSALNPAHYSIERWNYQRTANYGSPHFKLDGSKGQDNLAPGGVYLSRDRKSVFIGVADMQPVMQMRLGWSLQSENGMKMEQNAFFSPFELATFQPEQEGFEPVVVDVTPNTDQLSEKTVVSVEEGRRISELMGCVACHSLDGSMLGKSGPSWKGLFGSERILVGNQRVVADESYLRESILQPAAHVVKDFEKSDVGMPSYEGVITDEQIQSLILYIKTIR